MKTRYFLLSAALVFATLLTGCTAEGILKLNNIQVSKSMVEIEMNGGSPTIDVTTNAAWAIEAFDADGKMAMTNLVFPSLPYSILKVKGGKTTIYDIVK